MMTKWNWCLFIGGLCCTNALLWLSFNPIPWWPIAISATVGVILVTIGVRQRQKELREIVQGEIPVSDNAISLTLFTSKEAERCPGNWIAVCGNSACNFCISRMPASGMAEAKKIAFERHERTSNPNNFQYSRHCSTPEILVGRVPDE